MEIKNISKALVAAQRQFAPVLKDKSNPFFKSKYADLSVCVAAVIDALNANGIMLMQPTHECDSGVLIETLFIHESGETLSAGKLHVPAVKSDAQAYGSALTYARRYSLMAACGLAPEDDDGNSASKNKSKTNDAYTMFLNKHLQHIEDTAEKGMEPLSNLLSGLIPEGNPMREPFLKQHWKRLKQIAENAEVPA